MVGFSSLDLKGGCDDYITAKNFAVKCFIVQAPGEKMAKKFYKTGAL
jgi:hypothetical protein